MPALTMEFEVQFTRGRFGRNTATESPKRSRETPPGRVPRVARLLALAIKLDAQVRRGDFRDLAEIARVGHVSRARVTQIMGLLNLAPDIQEAILTAPLVTRGRDPISEQHLRRIVGMDDWRRQRRSWAPISRRMEGGST